ncbi:MAG: glycosyltransferase, partial [Pseudomonadales bacterium]
QIAHEQLIRLFQISAAHIYLTYPFVLSWSVLEAMACGAPVIASNTGPCLDIIKDRHNGLLSDFWDSDALVEKMKLCLTEPGTLPPLRQEARRTIAGNFALQNCLEQQTSLIERLISARQ